LIPQHALTMGAMPPRFVLRDPVPGDLGFIIHRQARLYADEYGWDGRFEGLLAEVVANYVKHFEPTHEHCWVAELEGSIVGSAFVVRKDEHTAQLRMLYVDRDARGHGVGRALVAACLAFARKRKDYKRMVLWTNDVLVSARRIYEAEGFKLIASEPHQSFGRPMVGQTWELWL
jgi:GNAT superfamily N-acetyltransferase